MAEHGAGRHDAVEQLALHDLEALVAARIALVQCLHVIDNRRSR